MDKTYAEATGHAPFDWNRFLDRAISGEISEEEHAAASKMAHDWTTCACGNQCAIIPRTTTGFPVDDKLCALGGDFFAEVDLECFAEAKATLAEIESRSAVLIAEEVAKLNSK